MLKNEKNLTQKQLLKFDRIRQTNLGVSRAWQIRENFKSMFNTIATPKAAYVLFDHCFNNAMAQRLNGKIHILKTMARGYRTFDNFRRAILFFMVALNDFC